MGKRQKASKAWITFVEDPDPQYTYEDIVKANPSYALVAENHMEFDNTDTLANIYDFKLGSKDFTLTCITYGRGVFNHFARRVKELAMSINVPDNYNKFIYIWDPCTGEVDFLGKLTNYRINRYCVCVNPSGFKIESVDSADLHVESIGGGDLDANGCLTKTYNDIVEGNKLNSKNFKLIDKNLSKGFSDGFKAKALPAPKKHPKKGPWPIELEQLFDGAGVTSIIFSGDWTVVKFSDGIITKVRRSGGSEDDSRETAILYCLAKHAYPSIKHDLHKAVKVAKTQKPHDRVKAKKTRRKN